MQKKLKFILLELKSHLPFSVLSSALGIMLVGILTILLPLKQPILVNERLFHIFHPLHLLASAMATTAMYWKYRNSVMTAILIGLSGATIICSISDILLPFLGSKMLGLDIEFHLCLKEHPLILIPFLAIGIVAGFYVAQRIERPTIYSHTFHVILSTMASIFYLISFGIIDWIGRIALVFVVVTVAVVIPCCLSDIVFPLIFVKKQKA